MFFVGFGGDVRPGLNAAGKSFSQVITSVKLDVLDFLVKCFWVFKIRKAVELQPETDLSILLSVTICRKNPRIFCG